MVGRCQAGSRVPGERGEKREAAEGLVKELALSQSDSAHHCGNSDSQKGRKRMGTPQMRVSAIHLPLPGLFSGSDSCSVEQGESQQAVWRMPVMAVGTCRWYFQPRLSWGWGRQRRQAGRHAGKRLLSGDAIKIFNAVGTC